MIALLLLLAIDGYLLMKTPNAPSVRVIKGETVTGGSYTVYGTMKCGWTRKQLDYMKSKNIQHTFIDCETNPEKCKGMKGYPVVEFPSGEKKVGFQEV